MSVTLQRRDGSLSPEQTSRAYSLCWFLILASLSLHYKVMCFAGWRTQGAELGRVGRVHLSSYFDGDLYVPSHSHCTVCIHLATLACQQIEMPEPARTGASTGAHLGISGGRLCYYSGSDDTELIIWMLDTNLDTCMWPSKRCICLQAITEQESSTLGSARLLACIVRHVHEEKNGFWY